VQSSTPERVASLLDRGLSANEHEILEAEPPGLWDRVMASFGRTIIMPKAPPRPLLVLAASNRNDVYPMVKLLLYHAANVKQAEMEYPLFLEEFALAGDLKTLELLIARGAVVDIKLIREIEELSKPIDFGASPDPLSKEEGREFERYVRAALKILKEAYAKQTGTISP
jgi:hypothetical protein